MMKRAIIKEIRKQTILVMMPSYNEADNLPAAVKDLRLNLPRADLLVIDDGSADDTAKVAVALGCKLLRLPFNIGIGGAVQAGYKYAHEYEYDLAVQFDGDGQHSAGSLPQMIKTSMDGNWDLVIGSRYLRENEYVTPLARRLGMIIFSKIVSLIIGERITDSTSGFRVTGKRAIAFCACNYPSDYPEVEVLPQLHFAGLRITEVPAEMRQRQSGKSSITWSKAMYYMIKVVLAISISLLREKPVKKKGAI